MSTTPSTSPPRTPIDARPSSRTNTPSSDDSSIIDDLSFDYGFDENGNFIRLSKGGRNRHSSPVTPPENTKRDEPSPESPKESSPAPAASPLARTSLTRSESASELLGLTNNVPASESKPLRNFQRTTSGPILPSAVPQPSYLAPTIASQRARMGPRRITMEDNRDRPEAYAAARTRLTLDSSVNSYALHEEKENINGEMSAIEERPAALANRRNSPPLHARSVTSRMTSNRTSYSTTGANPRPLSDVPVPQRAPTSRQIQTGLNRPGRIMKAPSALKYSTSNVERLGEVTESEATPSENEYQGPVGGEDTEPEDEPAEPTPILHPSSALPPNGIRQRRDLNANLVAAGALSMSNSNRPRRSASLSDAHHHDDYQLQVAQPHHANSRPGTSMGLNGDPGVGARRVAPEERERQELEARAAEYRKYRREEDIVDEARQARQSPSPTHSLKGQQGQRPAYGHRRRDSDTLRGLAGPSGLNSPTIMTVKDSHAARPSPTPAARHGRLSPSTRGGVTPPTAKGRASPPGAKGRASPPIAKPRLSPQTSNRLATSREAPKMKRSPTTPEPSTADALLAAAQREEVHEYSGKNEDRERERERDYERERRERREPQPAPAQQAYNQMPPPQAPAPAPPQPVNRLNRHIVVNKKAYARLDMIGKGGSSRVFRVLNHANELYAIKRVSLDKTDAETMSGYMNEIALLKRLEGNSRIIRLIDSEVKAGPGGSKGHLLLVMECGEVDLARLLSEQMRERLNMVWVAYYWQQMLQAVHVIHEEKIVHSDLKPANFVLVRGQLKLIDFGIANAIANDTTNIQRDHQIGTVNYMSPEAIELPDGMRRLKVGRPSDVWSLGCILYQMVYGHPPFQHLSVYQKMKAIPDISHVIDFPEYSSPCIPSKPGPTGQPQQPKRLEHLKKRVPKGVIDSMKSCLCRTSKERATIPQLLEQEWMAGPTEETEKEKPKSHISEFLGPQETVINPYYMRQLLDYGIQMGRNQGNLDPEAMLKEAERLVAELRAVQTGSSSS